MTLLDDAKLLTTANSYKAGVLYSIKPDDGNGDLDITRSTTATRVNPSGIIESVAVNEPQLDYTDGCGSFWVEPQSTNLISRSVDFSWIGYFFSNASVTDSSVTSPDGGANASEITTTNSSHYMFTELTVTAGSAYTFSFYAKRGTMTDMNYAVYSWNASSYITSPTSYYSQTSSSWSRISVTFTVPSGTNTIGLRTLDDSGVTGTVSLWGLQLEKHTADMNMESSYIPTTSATVTRNATVFDKTGLTSTIGSTEGVLFAEIALFWNSATSAYPTSGQRMMGWKNSNGRAILGTWGGTWFCWLAGAGGNAIFSLTPIITETSFVKMAVKYKAGDQAYWKDGVEITTATDASAVSATQDRIVSSYEGISNFWEFYGKIRSIQVYNTALSDAQLLALTT